MTLPTRWQSRRTRTTSRTNRRRRGGTLAYASIAIVVMCGVISLAVDYGRVQLARTQLQTAADTAARYAASGVKHEIDGVNAAQGMALAVLAENKVDGSYVQDSQATVEVGLWNTSSHSFTPNDNLNVANAVRVTLKASDDDSTSIPLMFARILGRPTQQLTASSVALYDADKYLTGSASTDGKTNYQQKYVPATSNIWLSGNAAGTVASLNNPHNSPDYAGTSSDPQQSPVGMDSLRVTPGSTLTFDGVNGGANNDKNDPNRYNGDGNTAKIVTNSNGGENGKSNVTAPINAVIAVFLDDSDPKWDTPPVALDFSTATSRDFQTLRPQLNQTFFIGDGRSSNGDLQHFVVPTGATRLFIGTMDAYEWNNNVGGFTVTATSAAKVVIVR